MSREFVSENEASRKQLCDFVEGLEDADFERVVGEWTIASWFCHLAFWDRIVLSRIEALQRHQILLPQLESLTLDSINDACNLLSCGVPGGVAARMAIDSAEAVDSQVERLDDGLVRQLESAGMHRVLRRSLHRMHHLEKMMEAMQSAVAKA